jgi:hypothetical protein
MGTASGGAGMFSFEFSDITFIVIEVYSCGWMGYILN